MQIQAEKLIAAQCDKSPAEQETAPLGGAIPARSASCLETPVITRQIARRGPIGIRTRVHPPAVAENSTPERVEISPGFEAARVLRKKVLQRLLDENEDELAASLARCGETFLLHCSSCGFQHVAEKRCSQKWCPVCVRKIATQRSLKYERAAALCQWPMFLTLTRANLGNLSATDIRDLRKRFGRFRRQVFWKKNVTGGVACIEVTNTGRGWHPHLHCLLDCRWLGIETPEPKSYHSRTKKKQLFQRAAAELERNWSDCLGQLVSSVKVKRTSGADIIKEVCKYAVKGSDLVESPDPIGPAIWAMKSTRLVTSFGSFFGKNLVTAEEKKPPLPCPACNAKDAWVTDAEVQAHMRGSFDKKRGR